MWEKIFGPRPLIAALGYLAGAIMDARVLIETGGQPETAGAWMTLAFGVVMAAWGRVPNPPSKPIEPPAAV